MAAAIHAQNGKVVAQLTHTGAKANPKLFPEQGDLWGPSAITDPMTGNTPRAMTLPQIGRLIEDYAAAAARSKKAGFDGIQIHGAHGYGINQFLSGASNRRGDASGGDIDQRYRFLGETLEAARGAVGEISRCSLSSVDTITTKTVLFRKNRCGWPVGWPMTA